MGNPQTEDGYTRIANELLDAVIACRFSARQFAIVMAVIRRTYGFNKKSDEISLSQFESMTGIAKRNVCVVLQELQDMGVLLVAEGHSARNISINKSYKKWGFLNQELSNQEFSKEVKKSSQVKNSLVLKLSTTKDILKDSKDNLLSGKPDVAGQVLDFLNVTVGSNFRPVKANISLIEARIKEGATLDDFKRVIKAKSAEWSGDAKMEKYLRPSTLFNATKFNDYLGVAPAGSAAPKKCRMNRLGMVEVFSTVGGVPGWMPTEFSSIEDYEAAHGVTA